MICVWRKRQTWDQQREETPYGKTPREETPCEETSQEETPHGKTPHGETPLEVTLQEETPQSGETSSTLFIKRQAGLPFPADLSLTEIHRDGDEALLTCHCHERHTVT